MKKYDSIELLDQLQSDVREILANAVKLKNEDSGKLLLQPGPGKWSVVQVLEHLNSYGRYYLAEMDRSLQMDLPATGKFTPGWLGNYFTKLMLPTANGTIGKKMRSPKDHHPPADLDVYPVLNTFIEQQHHLLQQLEKAKTKDIGRIRTPISISRFIRLKLGDTFRFFIAHEQRHFVQIARVMDEQ